MPAGSLRAWSIVAALCVATSAHADYKDNYALGLKAYGDGDYAKARELMQQALAEHPEPAARIRLYGQRWEPYLPQYYLGMVAFKQGDCTAALAQWNAPASRQVVAQLPEISSAQQRDAATCEQKAVAKVEEKPKPQPAPETPPAKTIVAENPAKPASPPPAAPKPVEVAPEPVASPAKRVDVAVAKPAPPVATPPAAKPPPGNAPPAPLEEAFDNYLAGRYAKVERLNPEAITDTRARFHAYMVRAAARFTLAQIGSDSGELDGARADARAAHALDGRATPDAALFSPRFRTFYLETR